MLTSRLPATAASRGEPLAELLRSPGPCITFVLAANATPDKANVLLDAASAKLCELSSAKAASAELLAPLRHTTFFRETAHSRMIFLSPVIIHEFRCTRLLENSVSVGRCFAIRELLPELALPRLFYFLTLEKASATLRRCSCSDSENVAVPPPSRAASTSDYYRALDQAVASIAGRAPVVLGGANHAAALFRRISSNRNLVSATVSQPAADFLPQALAALHSAAEKAHSAAIRTTPDRCTELDLILHGAFEARVRQLYISDSAHQIGLFDRGAYRSSSPEDLLNLAAVQTILHGGEAFVIPQSAMPEKAPAAAIFRH
jgi:hypothetical protein